MKCKKGNAWVALGSLSLNASFLRTQTGKEFTVGGLLLNGCSWFIIREQLYCLLLEGNVVKIRLVQWRIGTSSSAGGWGTALRARGFDSRWCQWKFSLTYSLRPHYGPVADSASNRNENHENFLGGKGGRCVGLTTLPPSCANCLEIWELLEPSGPVQICNGVPIPFYNEGFLPSVKIHNLRNNSLILPWKSGVMANIERI